MMNVKLRKMDHRAAQQVLAAAGLYKGAIDGDLGPRTMEAVLAVEAKAKTLHAEWTDERRVIGAVQRILDDMGYEPGLVDGYAGHNTLEALTLFLSDRVASDSEVKRDREPPALIETIVRVRSSTEQLKYPVQADVPKFYGPAGGPLATAGVCKLPIPFYLSWNVSERVNQFRCHEKVAEPMTRVFAEAVKHYGESEYRRLRLDLFGGCYNYRKMRGSTAVSMHAYGIAFDLDPDRNQLRWDSTRAAFAKDDYVPFWNIVVQCGGTPAGYAWDGDWMHAQWARLK